MMRYILKEPDGYADVDELIHRPNEEDVRVTACGITAIRDGIAVGHSIRTEEEVGRAECSECFPK